jgi:hypothetical protein
MLIDLGRSISRSQLQVLGIIKGCGVLYCIGFWVSYMQAGFYAVKV